MNNIEKLGGALDHLNEQGLKNLIRQLQQRIYNSEAKSDRYKEALEEIVKSKCKCWKDNAPVNCTCGLEFQEIARQALEGKEK